MRSIDSSLRANQLLISALRTPHALPSLPNDDWELLLRVARRARLLGRLEVDLRDAGLLGQIPPRAATHLIAARNVIEHRNTLVAWEVNRILWALRDLKAPLILLKGAAYLLAQLPPSRGRIFADVDLLVPEDLIGEIEDSLIAHNWFRVPLDPYDDRYYRAWTHEIPPLRHRERGTEIDIHHRLVPRTSRIKSSPDPLFTTTQPLADARLHVLEPCDMVLHALVHLFLDGDPDEGLRFRDLVDAHELLSHFGVDPDFWAALASRARTLGFGRLLFYGLRCAQRFLDTQVPSPVLEDLADAGPRRPIPQVMDKLIADALLPGHPDYPKLRERCSRTLFYARAHWLRMPAMLLARHLSYKAWLRLRKVPKKVDLAQLDLRQQ